MRHHLIPFVLLALTLSGASKGADSDVLATVNGAPVTLEEVSKALKIKFKYGSVSEQSEVGKKAVLEELIENKLIENFLKKDGSFESPALKDEIEIARQGALRGYFASEKIGKVAPPTRDEIAQYAKDHKNIFAGRKAFHYSSIIFRKSPKIDIHNITAKAMFSNDKRAKSGSPETANAALSEIAGYLTSISENFTYFKGYKYSEEIDANILKILESARPNDMIVDYKPDDEFDRVVVLYSAEPEPVDSQTVVNAIYNGLLAERVSENIKNSIAKLRADAQIKYNGAGKK